MGDVLVPSRFLTNTSSTPCRRAPSDRRGVADEPQTHETTPRLAIGGPGVVSIYGVEMRPLFGRDHEQLV